MQTVQLLNSVRMIFWIRLSVAVSTDAVASSSTRIFACFSNALPREINCLCPTLQLSPFSRTTHQRKIKEEYFLIQRWIFLVAQMQSISYRGHPVCGLSGVSLRPAGICRAPEGEKLGFNGRKWALNVISSLPARFGHRSALQVGQGCL